MSLDLLAACATASPAAVSVYVLLALERSVSVSRLHADSDVLLQLNLAQERTIEVDFYRSEKNKGNSISIKLPSTLDLDDR